MLNRRTAPDLYLAVRPIRRNDDGLLNFGDDGEPIDWLLEMRRFPDDALLEQVAARGALTEPLVLRLTDRIKSFHDSAEQVRSRSGRERIEAVIAGNRESMATSSPRSNPVRCPSSADAAQPTLLSSQPPRTIWAAKAR